MAVGEGKTQLRIRCVLVVELMFAFTLLALRCVNIFYSKRVKAVELIQRDFAVRFLCVGKRYGRGGGLGRGLAVGLPLGAGVVVGVGDGVQPPGQSDGVGVTPGVIVSVGVAVGVDVGVIGGELGVGTVWQYISIELSGVPSLP